MPEAAKLTAPPSAMAAATPAATSIDFFPTLPKYLDAADFGSEMRPNSALTPKGFELAGFFQLAPLHSEQ